MVNGLASIGALWIVVGLIAFLLFAYFVPVFVFRIMRNTRNIALQLARLNDNLETGRSVRVEIEDSRPRGEQSAEPSPAPRRAAR